MKKLTKVVALATVASALFAFASCTQPTQPSKDNAGAGGEVVTPDNPTDTEETVSGDKITFKVTEAASTNATDTVLLIKYDRTAKGAKEKITLTDVDLEVFINNAKIEMKKTIDFTLDEYGAGFEDAKTPITDMDLRKEYKVKIPVGKKLAIGDTVTVELKTAKVTGEGADKVDLSKVVIALVDVSKEADYYTELCANKPDNKNEYLSLISVEDDSDDDAGNQGDEDDKDEEEDKGDDAGNQEPVNPPAEDKGDEGTGDAGNQEPANPPAEGEGDEGTGDAGDQGGEGDVATVTNYVLDFSGDKLPTNYYCTAEDNDLVDGALKLAVDKAWDGAFKISIPAANITGKKVKVEYKVEEGWTGDNNNNKIVVQVISAEQTSGEYKALELSQADIASKDNASTEFTTVTADLYANNWDVAADEDGNKANGAQLDKIIAVKVNTQSCEGTVYIKSISFVDAE